jgi:WD40 repeat protein
MDLSSNVDADERAKERARRQQEIALLTQAMTSTEATWQPKSIEIVANITDNENITNEKEESKSNGVKEIETDSSIQLADDFDTAAMKHNIPISHQVDLSNHKKAVVCASFEPSGNRIITGSLDYNINMYDFGGMDARHNPFNTFAPQDGNCITSMCHSPTGDAFIVGTMSAQPKVFSRDGTEIVQFVRGDMYIVDITHTKGHTMEVTAVKWHPTDKHTVITSSLDGSIRIWDLNGERNFNMLMNKHVLKIRPSSGQPNQRLGATCCLYSPNGKRIIGGAVDGSIHIFNEKKVYSRADIIIKHAQGHNSAISSILFSKNDYTLVSRGNDDKICIWDIRKPKQEPVKVINSTYNSYPSANLEFNPNENIICCGISSQDSSNSTAKGPSNSTLAFYEVNGKSCSPYLQLGITQTKDSVNTPIPIYVKWCSNTNQICVTLSNGYTRIFYDPRISKKGALLSSTKAVKREFNPIVDTNIIVGEIINPNALPMYRNEGSLKRKIAELKDPIKTKVPDRPLDKGPIARGNSNFTKYVVENSVKNNDFDEDDPRAKLLKYDEIARADPMFTGAAYMHTQPKAVLHSMTFEEEQEEFFKNQKKALDIDRK